MKTILMPMLAATIFLGLAGIACARPVPFWPYQELLEKSDLVVIATAAANSDTKEHIELPGFSGEHVIGVETKFTISAILKGDKTLTNLVFHHYRTSEDTNISHLPDGPTFVSFVATGSRSAVPRAYILFLVREADGRYAPVVGQTDPDLESEN